jgi:hypothetical protein
MTVDAKCLTGGYEMYRTIKFALLLLFAAIPFAGAQTKLPPVASKKVDYKQDIQPLLAQK